MAINKYMLAALKALSYMEIEIKENYKLIRKAERFIKKPRIKLTYKTWDYQATNNGYDIPIRIFNPSKENEIADQMSPVIIYFHGGGWVTGDLDSYEKVCLTTARQTGYMLYAVDYRLAPEHPYPAALEDCYYAVKAVMQLRKTKNFILMGDSAGGNLAAALSLYMRDRGEPPAKHQILIYPAVYNNHTEASPFLSVTENGKDYLLTSARVREYMELYCPVESDRNSPYIAPLLASDFSNQPDTLIITAQYDPLRDEGEEYGRRLQEAGNRVVVRRIEDALHGYFSLPLRFSQVRETYHIVNQFLQGEGFDEQII